MELYEIKDFNCFIDFLIIFNQDLIDKPIKGYFYKIHFFFLKYCYDNQNEIIHEKLCNLNDFFNYVNQFNVITKNSLVFENEIDKSTQLEWINFSTIFILKNKLDNNFKVETENSNYPKETFENNENVFDKLISFLEKPLYNDKNFNFYNNENLNEFFNIKYNTLDGLLRSSTAKNNLSREKAKLSSVRKKFYEVCNDSEHANILSCICFNKKNKNQSDDLKELHKNINDLKKTIPNNVYECSQCKIHYLSILNSYSDPKLGDCSYLDTCHKIKTCRYLHYYTLIPINKKFENEDKTEECFNHEYTIGDCFTEYHRKVLPSQWINCDVRFLPFLILGKFSVIISDPAWDIHMSLPYGTCKDFELLSLPMHKLQDEGILLLWVTGRSIEVGRKALKKWGYKLSDEIIWTKLNQLKKTIVTGRTGHWLNHSKEHLLVGIKGNPFWINRKIDIDVVVSGTRETLRKPDEIYDIVERIVGKHSRKLEIFGRDNNKRPGWVTIGNQLYGSYLYETEIKINYNEFSDQEKFEI